MRRGSLRWMERWLGVRKGERERGGDMIIHPSQVFIGILINFRPEFVSFYETFLLSYFRSLINILFQRKRKQLIIRLNLISEILFNF